MNSIALNRLTPLHLRNNRTTSNRVVVPPMASETADAAGLVTPQTIEHYRRLAQSGAGIVWVEYTYVDRKGRSETQQLGIDTDDHTAGLALVAQAIQSQGALAGIQLTHSGGKTSRELASGALQGPSRVAVPAKDRQLEVMDDMTLKEISEWKISFLKAAHRAVQAGFEMIEIHAAHGYGINQWLSAVTNQRSDRYGGSRENRFRILTEIVTAIRSAHPELIIAARIPGRDFLKGGLETEDSIALAQQLESIGLDILDVSSGLGGWRRPRDREGEGYLVEDAALIQAQVRIPVIGVGGIETGTYIDQALKAGSICLAAVGRAILKDPYTWGARWLHSNHGKTLAKD